jgi:Legionella pneumophila major outer membrane protein precursor
MRQLLLAISLFVTSIASAAYWPEHYEFGAELLWLKPSPGSPLVARQLTLGEINTVAVKPDFDWGFRFDVGYQWGCFFGFARYLWLETLNGIDTRRDEGAFLDVPPLAFDMWNNSRADLRIHYQNVDLRGGQFIYLSERCKVFAFMNIRWADIVRRLRVIASNSDAHAKYVMKSEMDGSGIGLGAGTQLLYWKRFSLRADINVMGLIADRKFSTWRVTDPEGRLSLLNARPLTSLIPAVDFRLGAHGYYSIGCVTAIVEVGYEVNHYWNALRFALPNMASISGSKIVCQDVTFAGPYFKLSAMF